MWLSLCPNPYFDLYMLIDHHDLWTARMFPGSQYSYAYSAKPALPVASAYASAYGAAMMQMQQRMSGMYPGMAAAAMQMPGGMYPGAAALPPTRGPASKKQKRGGTLSAAATTTDDHACVGDYAMLLCRVVVGRSVAGQVSMRKPPDGHESVHGPASMHGATNYAIFDNAQVSGELHT